MLELVLALNIFALLGIAIVAVMKYRLTRDRGLLALLVALVGWPLCAFALGGVVRMFLIQVVTGGPVIFPFTLVQAGELSLGSLVEMLWHLDRLVSSALVLVAVWMLYRSGRGAQVVYGSSEQPRAV